MSDKMDDRDFDLLSVGVEHDAVTSLGRRRYVNETRRARASEAEKAERIAELEKALEKWLHWHDVDSTEANRDDAYSATKAVLEGGGR